MPSLTASYELGLINAISRAAIQHKTAVAIAAVDKTMLVNLQIDARMPKRGWAIAFACANGAGAVATNAASFDKDGFGRRSVHGPHC